MGFETGGRENVGREDGEKRSASSSVDNGSGGSIGTYLLRTEAIVFFQQRPADEDAQAKCQCLRTVCLYHKRQN